MAIENFTKPTMEDGVVVNGIVTGGTLLDANWWNTVLYQWILTQTQSPEYDSVTPAEVTNDFLSGNYMIPLSIRSSSVHTNGQVADNTRVFVCGSLVSLTFDGGNYQFQGQWLDFGSGGDFEVPAFTTANTYRRINVGIVEGLSEAEVAVMVGSESATLGGVQEPETYNGTWFHVGSIIVCNNGTTGSTGEIISIIQTSIESIGLVFDPSMSGTRLLVGDAYKTVRATTLKFGSGMKLSQPTGSDYELSNDYSWGTNDSSFGIGANVPRGRPEVKIAEFVSDSQANYGNKSVRIIFGASYFADNYVDYVVDISAGSSGSAEILQAYIGKASSGGNAWDFDGTQVPLTLDNDGSFTISANSVVVTDMIDGEIDSDSDLIVAIDFSTNGYVKTVSTGGANYGSVYTKTTTGVTESNLDTPISYTEDTSVDLAAILSIRLRESSNETVGVYLGASGNSTHIKRDMDSDSISIDSKIVHIGKQTTDYIDGFVSALYWPKTGCDGYSFRQLLPSDSLIQVSGNKIRITISCGPTNSYYIAGMYIGYKASSGNNWDFDGSQVSVKWDSGSATKSLSADNSYTSDWIDFPYDRANGDIIISWDSPTGTSQGEMLWTDNVENTVYLYSKATGSGQEASLSNPTGYSGSSGEVGLIKAIQITEYPGDEVQLKIGQHNGFKTDGTALYIYSELDSEYFPIPVDKSNLQTLTNLTYQSDQVGLACYEGSGVITYLTTESGLQTGETDVTLDFLVEYLDNQTGFLRLEYDAAGVTTYDTVKVLINDGEWKRQAISVTGRLNNLLADGDFSLFSSTTEGTLSNLPTIVRRVAVKRDDTGAIASWYTRGAVPFSWDSYSSGAATSSSLTITDGTATVYDVEEITFDPDYGLTVINNGDGTATINTGSFFKTIQVTGQDDIVANKEDILELVSGTGIVITTDDTATPQSITIATSLNEGLDYQGTWNASTNIPDISATSPSNGDYYKVAVAGTTNLNGITSWAVNDWVIYNPATGWDIIGNAGPTSAEVDANTAARHDRQHAMGSTDDHTGIVGATEDNLAAFDANGLIKDSLKSVDDLEVSTTDGTVTVNPISSLTFVEADGFSVTDGGSGEAVVGLSAQEVVSSFAVPVKIEEQTAHPVPTGTDIAIYPYAYDTGSEGGNDANTVLLLSSDTINGNAVFKNYAEGGTHTVAASGGATHSSTQAKIGNTAIKIDAPNSSQYLNVYDSLDDFEFGSGLFTVDVYVYLDEVTGTGTRFICGKGGGSNGYGTDGYEWHFGINSAGLITFVYNNGGAEGKVESTYQDIGQGWHHLAVVQDATNIKLYVDGIEVGTSTKVTITETTSGDQRFIVGSSSRTSFLGEGWIGYIDELRISKGVARWTTAFTPQATHYLASTVTRLYYKEEDKDAHPVTPEVSDGSTTITIPKSITFDSSDGFSITTDGDDGVTVSYEGSGSALEVTDGSTTESSTDKITIGEGITLTSEGDGDVTLSVTGTGVGDMMQATYDPDQNGVVEQAERLNDGSFIVTTEEIRTHIDSSSADELALSNVETEPTEQTDKTVLYAKMVPTIDSDAYTKVLIQSNTTNNDPVFEDSSIYSKTIGVNGSVVHSTTQYKFGTTSIYFPGGASDYLTIPASDDSNFGNSTSGDFTIDFHLKTACSAYIIGINSPTTSSPFWGINVNKNVANRIQFYSADLGGEFLTNSTTNIADDNWHHIALVRTGNLYAWYIDGGVDGTASIVTAFGSSAYDLLIGKGGIVDEQLTGYIDELRISKGIARWTVGFTPPTSSYTIGPVVSEVQYKRDDGTVKRLGSRLIVTDNTTDVEDVNELRFDSTDGLSIQEVSSGIAKVNVDLNATQVGLGNVTDDAQLKRAANDFSSFSEKTSIVSADCLLIEDSADSDNKKYLQMSNLPALKRIANDFNTFSEKLVAESSDIVLIEDSGDSGNKKYLQLSNLPATESVTFDNRVDTPEEIYGKGKIFLYGKTADIDSDTHLLIESNTAISSTDFTDLSPYSNTIVNYNIQLTHTTAQQKFGLSSMGFGNGKYLTVTGIDEPGTGDFCIDLWIYVIGTITSAKGLVSASNELMVSLQSWGSGLGLVRFEVSGVGTIDTGPVISGDTWYHIAAVRDNGTMKTAVNGVFQITRACTRDFTSDFGSFTIGRHYGSYFSGYMDEIRVSIGTPRWNSNFTPPTEAYTAVGAIPQDLKFVDDSGATYSLISTEAGDVGLSNVTDDAQLKRTAGDFVTFTEKTVPVNADVLLVEDSADSNNKKHLLLGSILSSGIVSPSLTFEEQVTAPLPSSNEGQLYVTGAAGVPTNIQLLVQSESTQGSTVIEDSSTYDRSLTVDTGAPIHSTAAYKFGTSSLYFNGSSRLNVGGTGLDPGTQDFTFECWFNMAVDSGRQTIFGRYGSESDMFMIMNRETSGDGIVKVAFSSAGSFSTTFEPNIATWYHLVVARKSAYVKVFIDGTAVGGPWSVSQNLTSVDGSCLGGDSAIGNFNGYLEDVRYIVGEAVWYDSNFTAPTSSYNYAIFDQDLYFKDDLGSEYCLTDITTKASLELDNVTNDAQLKRAASDFTSFTEKTDPISADILLIEDSADSNNKKKIELGNIINKRKPTVVSAATYSVAVDDQLLHVTYTSTGAVTVTIPSALVSKEISFIAKDATGNSGTAGREVTIATEGSETIDGSSTYVIDTNYGSVTIYSDGTNYFVY
ncbi:MAG: LamG domain-containing protein [bacterium]|nr:LamG domain-containing protein [bacterium]